MSNEHLQPLLNKVDTPQSLKELLLKALSNTQSLKIVKSISPEKIRQSTITISNIHSLRDMELSSRLIQALLRAIWVGKLLQRLCSWGRITRLLSNPMPLLTITTVGSISSRQFFAKRLINLQRDLHLWVLNSIWWKQTRNRTHLWISDSNNKAHKVWILDKSRSWLYRTTSSVKSSKIFTRQLRTWVCRWKRFKTGMRRDSPCSCSRIRL